MTADPESPDMLPTEEAALLVGVTERQFRRAYGKKLEAVEGQGGRKYYARPDLEAVRDARVRTLNGHRLHARKHVLVPDHDQALPPDALTLRPDMAMTQAITALAARVEAIQAEYGARETRLIAERDAERARGDALLAEIQRERDMRLRAERDMRLRAEWEAAQLRPLIAPPDLAPMPDRRGRVGRWFRRRPADPR